MLKVGLLSDTHGFLDDAIYKYFKDCDEIWHAGDVGTIKVFDELSKFKPTRAVYGNIDGNIIRSAMPEHLYFTVEGMNVFITHIGGYPGRYNQEVKSFLQANPTQLFICGHSHILKVQFDKKLNLLHMNPGAAGKSGFHQVRTMLRFVIDGEAIQELEIIEIEKRV